MKGCQSQTNAEQLKTVCWVQVHEMSMLDDRTVTEYSGKKCFQNDFLWYWRHVWQELVSLRSWILIRWCNAHVWGRKSGSDSAFYIHAFDRYMYPKQLFPSSKNLINYILQTRLTRLDEKAPLAFIRVATPLISIKICSQTKTQQLLWHI